jgi:hypothetical protein
MKIIDSTLRLAVDVLHESCVKRDCYTPKDNHGTEAGYSCTTRHMWGCPRAALDDIDIIRENGA